MKKIISKLKTFLRGPEIKPAEDIDLVPDYEAETLAMIAKLENAFDASIERQKMKYEQIIGDMHLMGVLAAAARDKIDLIIPDQQMIEYPELFEARKLLTNAIEIVRAGRPGDNMDGYQYDVSVFIVKAFGYKMAFDKSERNHRFMEESLELVQAAGCTKDEVLMLVDYVYGRPVGELSQEAGGVMVTLAGFCAANAINMNKCAKTELARAWEKIDLIREKQATKPASSPVTINKN